MRRLAQAELRAGLMPIAFATVPVLAMSTVAVAAIAIGVVDSWWGSPFVALVAVVTSWRGREAGLLAAVLSAVVLNLVFIPPAGFHHPSVIETIIYISMIGAVLFLYVRPHQVSPHDGRLLALGYVKDGTTII